MKKFMLVVCTILLAASAWAENGRHSTITVMVDGLTCTTQAGTGMFSALSATEKSPSLIWSPAQSSAGISLSTKHSSRNSNNKKTKEVR
jgi:hypothetical protein